MNGNQNNIPAPAPLPGDPIQPDQGSVPETRTQTFPEPPITEPPLFSPSPLSSPMAPPSSQPPPFAPRFQPTGPGPSIPSSPPPDVGIRTMASDLSSLKSSGGLEVKPKTFRPEEFNKEFAIDVKQAESAKGVKPVQPKSHYRALFISLAIVVFVVIAGIVIYFFVMPLIFPSNPPIGGEPITETPPVETPPAETPSVTLPLIHQSYFITSPTSTIATSFNNLNLTEVNSALNAAASGVKPQTVREITFTVTGMVPEADDFLSAVFPELNKEALAGNFERDFTVYLYRDANGSWPGYIFRLNPNSAVSQTAPIIKSIESSTNIPNIYLANLGAPSSVGFKDGLKIGETSARYLSFNTLGASFNYGWFNNHLIMSTSFNGFREALKLLGFSQ